MITPMKKYSFLFLLCVATLSLHAIPAYRGWQTKTQPDGTTIEVRLNGDELYHYYTNRSGEMVSQDADGYWSVVSPAPTSDVIHARRMQSPMSQHRMRKVGGINLAPRGLFILVNFSDSKFEASNTQAEMDSMMNAINYTYGLSYGSARRYFTEQSHGKYKPQFDVVGPVTLSKKVAYYGKNDAQENDMYPADMIVEACKLAKSQYNVDFTKYDNDNDGEIDFVYVIYAGKGEADGGAANTIWPHNWSVKDAVNSSGCSYKWADCKVDGLYINNYACSSEINGTTDKRNGIGVLCHEFSHVLGLPDYYDTDYGTNYKEGYTPNEWDIMDGGGYNAEGDCPPNYSTHEKYFFGWITPENPGLNMGIKTLTTNSTPLQINASGKLQSATTAGVNYYLENRQQVGWDKYLPGHGLLIWYVDYDQTAWDENTPNNTARKPRYTLISATGKKTGIGEKEDDEDIYSDAFPRGGKATSWTGLADKPISNITETNGVISFMYGNKIEVRWVVDGSVIETAQYTPGETLHLPTATVVPCEGTQFIGWTTYPNYRDPFIAPDDLFTSAEGKTVTHQTTYYALFE